MRKSYSLSKNLKTGRYIFPAMICIFILACDKKDSTGSKEVNDNEACYVYINKRDTVLLKLNSTGDSVTGFLTYNLFEKDKNTGTLEGKMNNGILIAAYTFKSEGRVSVREVAFKKDTDSFVEGYGEVQQISGRFVFVNPDSLEFNGLKLERSECNQLNIF